MKRLLRAAWGGFRNILTALFAVAAAIVVLEVLFRMVGIHPNLATALPVAVLFAVVWWQALGAVWRTAYRLAGGSRES